MFGRGFSTANGSILQALFVCLLVSLWLSGTALGDQSIEPLQDYYRICPLPPCTSCPTDEQLRAPGIGFALEIGHGTAAIRFHNGTYQEIALIEGDAAYKSLLRRLAAGPIDRSPDHFDTNWEKLEYVKARVRRALNKLLGRPATPDTAGLAAMVSALVHGTETSLGARAVTAAIITSPDRIKLTDEELNDVFDYLRIKNLMAEPDSLEKLYATSAAYAGYGKGLCERYTDAYECEREIWDFPTQHTLHIEFNYGSLSGTIKSLKGVLDGSVDKSFVSPELELGCVGETPSTLSNDQDDLSYWDIVSSRIRDLVLSSRPPITQVILTGTAASNEQFHHTLREALHDIVSADVLVSLSDTLGKVVSTEERESFFTFAIARGAAEMAKRRQEGPVRCAQSDECKRRREKGRQTGLRLQEAGRMEL